MPGRVRKVIKRRQQKAAEVYTLQNIDLSLILTQSFKCRTSGLFHSPAALKSLAASGAPSRPQVGGTASQ